ncbi:DNA cytosine methyltransferase [Microbispora amethystogenes]|uniref:DNA cytosine methyltransferase n=1 Tax=Microbispora amethystogenes TaxID=1427754 RepID=UPI003405565E
MTLNRAAPRIGSLCTGTGALDMAVMDVLGGSIAWHCQYDPDDRRQYAARILEHHWPGVPNHGDIAAADWTQVEPVDVLTAGFPCQDLSYAGRGAGIKEGTRSGLWYAVARAVGALRPRIVVLENVRAIVNRRPGLDVVLASLAELGFDAEWLCVPASDVGAPHERFRWFLLAWLADPAGDGHERGRRSWDGRTGSADSGVPAADPAGDGRYEGWAEPTRLVGRSDAALRRDGVPTDAASLGHRDARPAGIGGVPAPPVAGDPSGHVQWGAYEPAIRRWERILGRPAPRPTEPGRTGDRLSPAFVEWLMGLPAGWVTDVPGLTRNAQLKALGNGVVRQQAAYALRLLLARASREGVAA